MDAVLDRRTLTLPRTAGFWLLAGAFFALMFAAGAPTPLYVVYQSRWGFSTATLTVIFAVYALAQLVALVVAGGLSDFVGRRPVLVAGLLVEAVSMVLFLSADSVPWLVAARTVQGLATGALGATLSAALLDLQPVRRPTLAPLLSIVTVTVGLAAGALGTGLLIEFAPAPTELVYAVLVLAFVLLAATIVVLPESAPRRPGALASLRPRVRVPRPARGAFLAAAPGLVATWAMGGLYMSLGPTLAIGLLHLHSRFVGGLVVAALAGSGTVASTLTRNGNPRRTMAGGALVLAFGTVVTLVALAAASVPLFFTGTVVAGLGFGSSFFGAFRALAAVAPPAERAELFAAAFMVAYLAFSLPAVAAGLSVPAFGLLDTAIGYGVGVLVLALATALPQFVRRPAAPVPAPCSPAR
jgi:predicted MFS family arabinose efflux permease